LYLVTLALNVRRTILEHDLGNPVAGVILAYNLVGALLIILGSCRHQSKCRYCSSFLRAGSTGYCKTALLLSMTAVLLGLSVALVPAFCADMRHGSDPDDPKANTIAPDALLMAFVPQTGVSLKELDQAVALRAGLSPYFAAYTKRPHAGSVRPRRNTKIEKSAVNDLSSKAPLMRTRLLRTRQNWKT
jgi:hypothetical protein